jgi:hypothetical protein
VNYLGAGGWVIANETNSCSISGDGTGVYTVSFVADVPSASVVVSAGIVDQRGIFVQANATSVQV